jgi:peptidoglycan/xylan/chitin deacetylase (PgdA/CDA1 family)
MRLASLCYRALRVSGVTTLARRLSSGGVILCYHNVVAETRAGREGSPGLHMPLPTFERQARWLAGAYEVVPLGEFVGRLARGASLRGVAAVTFDDGYGGVFEHAWPLLRQLGLSATVFVVAEVPGRDDGFWWDHPEVIRTASPDRRRHWLTALRGDSAPIVESLPLARRPLPHLPPRCCRPAAWRTIAEAARSGLHLGVHSATHRSLPALAEAELQREVVDSREIIRSRTGVTAEFFAYPYGLWNERVLRAVRSAGYRAAFTLDGGRNATTTDRWTLRRVNIPAGIGDAAFQAWTAGLSIRPRDGS